MDKIAYITEFYDFISDEFPLDGIAFGKCYFKLENGDEYMGWIFEIIENNLVFALSGPLAPKDPVSVNINEINLNTLAYWDGEISAWTSYFGPNKLENRKRTKMKLDSDKKLKRLASLKKALSIVLIVLASMVLVVSFVRCFFL